MSLPANDSLAPTAALAVVAGRPPRPVHLPVVTLSTGERRRRAWRAAGLCLAAGVGSLFVPLLHWVLPWFSLLVAVFAYRHVAGTAAELTATTVACPACEHAVAVEQQTFSWPLETNCPSCRKNIQFRPIDAAVDGAGTLATRDR